MSNKILIIDIETTGFINQGGEIVEVGIVSLDLVTGEREILFDRVCRSESMTLESLKDTWIVSNGYMTAQEIIEADLFDSMKEEIQTIINSCEAGATAYNNVFDFGFLEKYGITFPKKLACPMKLSTDIVQVSWNEYYESWKWPNVEEAWEFFFPQISYVEKHRGADDAYHEALIVKELYERGIFILG